MFTQVLFNNYYKNYNEIVTIEPTQIIQMINVLI